MQDVLERATRPVYAAEALQVSLMCDPDPGLPGPSLRGVLLAAAAVPVVIVGGWVAQVIGGVLVAALVVVLSACAAGSVGLVVLLARTAAPRPVKRAAVKRTVTRQAASLAIEPARTVPAGVVLTAEEWEAQWHR